MNLQKVTFASLARLAALGILVIILTGLIPVITRIHLNVEYSPERHALLEYFVAYLGICLFLICQRRYFLQHSRDFLFFALGFLSLVIFQILQNLAFPGFHDFAGLPMSVNAAIGFDLAARIIFPIFFLIGIFYVNKTTARPSTRNVSLIYLSALFTVFLVAAYVYFFLPQVLYVSEHATYLKKALDIFAAVLLGVASVFLITRYLKGRYDIYFWFVVATILGIFANIYLSFWNQLFDTFYDAGHLLKILVFTSFLVGIFAEHIRFLRIETELRDSLQKSREELEKSEKTYRELVENMADGIIVIDKASSLIFCNQAFANMLHYKKEDIIGMHFSNFFDYQNYERIVFESERKAAEQAGQYEIEMLTREGKKLPVLISTVPITNAQGQFAGFQSVVTNLTEMKKIEKELENLVKEKTKDIEIFQQCIENSTEGIIITDTNGRINYINRAFENMTGFTKEELIGEKTSVLQYDRRSDKVHKNIWESVRDGRVWRGEFYTKRKDGSGFIGDVSVVPIQGEKAFKVGFLWIERDVTRRKTLEKSLQDYAEELTQKTAELETAKSYYETLISGMSDVLLVVDNDAKCTFINDYGIKRLGFRAEELTRENLPIFFDDLKKLETDYGTAIRVEIKDFEAVIKTKDGESILCSWHARPLFDRYNRRIGAMAVGRDITEHKKLQKELQDYAKNLENKVEKRTRELSLKVHQLAQLLELGEEIRLNVDPDVILNKICEALLALGWNKVIISLRDHERRTSRPVATAGLAPSQVEEVMSWGDIPFEHTDQYLRDEFRISNSYFVEHDSKIVGKKTPYSIYTDLGDRKEDEWHALDALLVPIRTKDKILGIISVDDPEDRKKPSLEKIRDLEIFADKAALAIENAHLFQAQKENERQAKLLAEMSKIFHSSLNMTEVLEAIVDKAGKAIGDFCSLILLDDSGELLTPQSTFHENPQLVDLFIKGSEYFPCRMGEGIIGNVVATGKPMLAAQPFAEEMNEFKETQFHFLMQQFPISSLIILPLRVRGRIIGAMSYLSFDSNRKYSKGDLKLAQDLADRAALAIENARLFEEAGQKAQELEKANRLKSEFLANVSHELRTPLNAIITLSDILIRGMPGELNQEQIKQLEIIQRSGKNLLNLINDILDLSKIEVGRVEPVYSTIPIRAVTEEAIEHIRPLCVEKGLSLEQEFSPEVPELIYSDQDKINKALMNLLSNAVKFTRRGKITVKMRLENKNKLRIDVKDTGIGIPKDRIDDIFKEFQQIDSSDARAYAGTGLGLAITRKVTEILGGSILVESQLGKGSTFTLLIPLLKKSEIAKDEIIDLDEKVADRLKDEVEIDITDDREKLDVRKKAVLVIDDEKEVIYIMRQYLHDRNYQILFPQNSEDVLELARRYKPFAITLDIIMPRMNGWDILESLKKDPDTKHIPVIVASILAEKDRAIQMGAAEYLVKPFEPEKLLDFLAHLESPPKKKRVVLDLPKISDLKKRVSKKLASFAREDRMSKESNVKILLVDDDEDTQYAMQYILEEAGYKVFFASEGREAVKQAEIVKPNLILMDIMMPGMDGYEATRILKAKEHFKNVPVVAMTAKAMKGDREKTFFAGCDDYIAKPFMTNDILKLVEKWLRASKMNDVGVQNQSV
ncbi:MAG: PAS domain S-box protein [bacterium]